MIKKVSICAVFRHSKPIGEQNKIDVGLVGALRCRGLFASVRVFVDLSRLPRQGTKKSFKSMET